MPTAYPGQPAYSSYYEDSAGPVAWSPPENMSWDDISVIESEEGVIESDIGGSVDIAFNPANTGIASHLLNAWQARLEAVKQQEGDPSPTLVTPDFEFTTVAPGGGELKTRPPGFWENMWNKVKGPEIEDTWPFDSTVPVSIPDTVPFDIPPTPAPNETPKAPGGWWDEFTRGVITGYNRPPPNADDENGFMNFIPGIFGASRYLYLGIAGGLVLLILIIK